LERLSGFRGVSFLPSTNREEGCTLLKSDSRLNTDHSKVTTYNVTFIIPNKLLARKHFRNLQ
jgi:hypothetical protein